MYFLKLSHSQGKDVRDLRVQLTYLILKHRRCLWHFTAFCPHAARRLVSFRMFVSSFIIVLPWSNLCPNLQKCTVLLQLKPLACFVLTGARVSRGFAEDRSVVIVLVFGRSVVRISDQLQIQIFLVFTTFCSRELCRRCCTCFDYLR